MSIRQEPLPSVLGFDVVAVGYVDDLPFAAITLDEHGGWDYWDFDWCDRDGTLYYHCHGGGPDIGVYDLGGEKVWAAAGIKFKDYERLDAPLGDPFSDAEGDTTTLYCQVCKDYLPDNTDRLCNHLQFCNECGAWIGSGSSYGQRSCTHLRSARRRLAREHGRFRARPVAEWQVELP